MRPSWLPALAVLAGQWRYHESATYELRELEGCLWEFREIHDSGRTVTGVLEPRGAFLEGVLRFADTQEECGTIRMTYIAQEGVVCSNLNPAGADWWSDDMVAVKETRSRKSSNGTQDRRNWNGSQATASPVMSREPEAEEEVEEEEEEEEDEGEGEEQEEPPSRHASSRSRGRSSTVGCRKRISSSGSQGKQYLDMIPTRVRAKLERSMTKSRRRAPSDDPTGGSNFAGPNFTGSPGPFSIVGEDPAPSLITPVQPVDFKRGNRKSSAALQEEKRRCCSTIFAACCRHESRYLGLDLNDISIDEEKR